MKHELQSRWFLAVAAFVMAGTAVALYAEPRALQNQPSGVQCNSTSVKTVATHSPDAEAVNVPMTVQQGAEILSELRAIRLLLQNGAAQGLGARRPPAPQNVRMQVKPGWHGLGRTNTRVTMVEFTDLQCPVCRRFQTTTFTEIKKDYIDTGKINFITRDLPLAMHSYALAAAEATRCAGDQGKFWQFRDAILDDEAPPAPDVVLGHATTLGLNLREFQTCLNEGKYKGRVQADQSDAAALGIRGTPAFVIGRSNGRWIEGLSMVGARPFPFFQQQIERMLNESSSESAGVQAPGGASAIRGTGTVAGLDSR